MTLTKGCPYEWIVVTDENGNDFHAECPDPHAADGDVEAWVRFTTENGFGEPNQIVLVTGLKKLDDGSGKYGR